MLRALTRQALAVVVALAVVSSFAGSPVAAATVLDTESDGELGTLGGDSESSGDTTGDDAGDEDTDDRDATRDSSTDGSSDDPGDGDASDEAETDDDETDDDETDDGSTDGDPSSDDSADEDGSSDGDDSDDDRSLGGDGSSSDLSLRSDDSTDDDGDDRSPDRVTDVVDGTTDAVDGTTDAVDGTTDAVENTTAGLEGSTDALEDDGVVETADAILDSVSETAIDLATLDLDDPFDGDDDREATGDHTYEESVDEHHEEPALVDEDGDGVDDRVEEDDGETDAGAGDGDRPEPADPAGAGATIGLGAVATAAALRGSPVVAGSKAVTSGGVLATLLERVRPFVLPLRYSRYDDSDPLEHEARQRVYEVVDETPGSYLSEVSDEAGLPLSTTRHHIKVLEREDLVTGAKLHGKRRFYPAYAEGIELAAALNDDSTATIIDAIARIGAASVSDLADELDRDPSTISHHLQRLEDDGVVTRERDGRAVVNKLSAEARTALEPEATPAGEAGEVVAGGAD